MGGSFQERRGLARDRSNQSEVYERHQDAELALCWHQLVAISPGAPLPALTPEMAQ